MADPSGFGSGSCLTFHGPLSAERADRLAAELAATRPETVADYGCGWGELLLRVLTAAPSARGVGIDIHGPDIARARESAGERGLAERAAFIEGPAADHTSKADAVINCGAYQAFGSIPGALKALRALVNPGGRLLFGAEIWSRTPTEGQLAAMWPGTTLETCLYLPDVVDAAVAAGFRPLRVQTATRGEWEEFESGLAAGAEEWLLANPDHPEAGQVRDKLDAHLSIWLRGHYEVMGFAYLTLGAPDHRLPEGPSARSRPFCSRSSCLAPAAPSWLASVSTVDITPCSIEPGFRGRAPSWGHDCGSSVSAARGLFRLRCFVRLCRAPRQLVFVLAGHPPMPFRIIFPSTSEEARATIAPVATGTAEARTMGSGTEVPSRRGIPNFGGTDCRNSCCFPARIRYTLSELR